jgi:hypothetical protein
MCRVPGGHCHEVLDALSLHRLLPDWSRLLLLQPHDAAPEVRHCRCDSGMPLNPVGTWLALCMPISICSPTFLSGPYCASSSVWKPCVMVHLLNTSELKAYCFGAAGSRFGDFCTWCWCAPCALCQVSISPFLMSLATYMIMLPTQFCFISLLAGMQGPPLEGLLAAWAPCA